MNMKLLGILAAGMLVVACGDSTGTGGSGGGDGGGGGGTGGTPVEGGGGSTGNMGGGGGALSCDEQCYADHQEGYDLIADLVIVYCGCTVGGDCEAECLTAADPACDDPPGTTGDACATCLMDAGTSGASCATTDAALSAECQANADCAALVTCVLSCP
ncbi:MAG: hypothetical protein IPM79_05425 [Polyangiaceae bacterium]|jgi:hypothetical protein|nr:hypothetical protein [Polyangiaceae bacterium]